MLTRFVVPLAIAALLIVGVVANAGRTEYDLKDYEIKTYGCDYEECSIVEGIVKVTVQNTHWVNYHGTPPALGEDAVHDSHDPAEQRYSIVENKTIIKNTMCDGTECEDDSGSDG